MKTISWKFQNIRYFSVSAIRHFYNSNEDDGQAIPDTPLYLKLRDYGHENFDQSFYKSTQSELVEFDIEKKRWEKNYIKIDFDTAMGLLEKQTYLDIDTFDL